MFKFLVERSVSVVTVFNLVIHLLGSEMIMLSELISLSQCVIQILETSLKFIVFLDSDHIWIHLLDLLNFRLIALVLDESLNSLATILVW